MNRRQRKKRHVGEFVEYYFEVYFTMKPGASIEAASALFDKFVSVCDAAGLALCGGGDLRGLSFTFDVMRLNPRRKRLQSATESDRGAMVELLRPLEGDGVHYVEVRPLLDANN